MNIINELREKFDIVEPIFDYELYNLGYTDEDIFDTLKENEFEELSGVDIIPNRIFYLVGYSELFNLYSKLSNLDAVVFKYFIGKDYEYGCLVGFSALNILNLSNQVSFSYTVLSNRVDNIIVYNNFKIVPSKDITDYKLLMCIREPCYGVAPFH